MLVTTFLFAYTFFMSCIWGDLAFKGLQKFGLISKSQVLGVGLDAWLGLAFISLPISILHFYFPIHAWMHLLFLLPLLLPNLGFLSIAKSWFERYQAIPKLPLRIAILAAIFSILSRPAFGDIADYHLQHILWAGHYPMVPGLGNFNRPLANNNWWFHIQSLFGLNDLNGLSLFPANAVLFLAAYFWFSQNNEGLNTNQKALRWVYLLFVILTLKTVFVGAVTPDLVITLTLFLMVDLMLRQQEDYWVIIIWLCAWLLTVKATAITFFMLPAFGAWIWFKNKNWSLLLKSTLLVLTYLIPWVIGNVWVSGYLLYPFSQIDLFAVDWKMPSWLGDFERFVLKQWGRIPYEDPKVTATLSAAQWLPRWFAQLDILNRILLIGSVVVSPFMIWKSLKPKRLSWVVLFLILGFALLFNNGPHPRFLFAYMVSMLALFAYCFAKEKWLQYLPKISLGLLMVLTFYVLLLKSDDSLFHPEVFVYPREYPKPAVEEKILNGHVVYITPNNNTCWDQFPCSYYFVDSIALRGSSLSDGFRWQTMPKP